MAGVEERVGDVGEGEAGEEFEGGFHECGLKMSLAVVYHG